MTDNTINYIDTDHAPLFDLSIALKKNRNDFWLKDAVEVGRANVDFADTPDLWVALRTDYISALTAPAGVPATDTIPAHSIRSMVVAADSETNVKANMAHALNIMIYAMVSKCTDKYIKDTPFADISYAGMELLETGGENDGFVKHYKPSSKRCGALASDTDNSVQGINPANGQPFSATEKKAYDKKQEKKRAIAVATKAKKVSDNAAKVAEAFEPAPAMVAMITDPMHVFETFRSRLESVTATGSNVTMAQCVQLADDILKAMPEKATS